MSERVYVPAPDRRDLAWPPIPRASLGRIATSCAAALGRAVRLRVLRLELRLAFWGALLAYRRFWMWEGLGDPERAAKWFWLQHQGLILGLELAEKIEGLKERKTE